MTTHDDQPTVYIVDDNADVRKSLLRLFKSSGIANRSFPSAEDFLKDCPTDSHGCLLLDVKMPGLSGLDLQQELHAHGIFLPVVFMTGHGDVPMSVRAFRAGAVNFLQKPFEDTALLDAVGEAVEQDGCQRQQRTESADAHRLIELLTSREREVLAMVVGGMMNKQIAHRLKIKEGTVKAHRSHIIEKLRVASVAELTLVAECAGVDRVTS